jgi:RNA polymerase sigma-70 factor (ECF subfamily)
MHEEDAASNVSTAVLPKKFLNTTDPEAVFMIEGRRVVAGEAILSRATTVERNSDEVLDTLVREHSRLVYRIAYAVLRRHHDAEDATQETFLRVLRYGSKLDAVEDLKTWLARIAWRVAVDRSKRRGGKREVPMDDGEDYLADAASSEIGAEETLYSAQVSRVLEKLIAALPEKLRQPLILSTVEEMSPREVAAVLAISEAAVRSRVFRARQILRERLADRIGRK